MPIYEYRCTGCQERFEELVSASASAPPCPICGSIEVARVFSPFATEWVPSIVSWHNAPGKFDGPGRGI
jgi:putative FmdB family regulatory protein